MNQTNSADIQIDIVSDVVCPWCIVGYLQLNSALEELQMQASIRWHPFELNPTMGTEGENLREHMMGKYGVSEEQSRQARDRLVSLGASLGFGFIYNDASKIVNTFRAHQLLDYAETLQLQHPLKLSLFQAYFSEGMDVSDVDVLVDIAASVGLDKDAAREVLASESFAGAVRHKEQFWTSRGISGVPSMIFAEKYLMTGAQGVDGYREILQRCQVEAA
ncbi:MAG: DsbA family oxidoreductase [Arenibacterium sp.]